MISDILSKRASVRSFLDREVPEEIIHIILEAGRLSPSGGNEQPWKFGAITDKQMINRISQCAYNQEWIKTAPLLVVLATAIVEDERGGRDIQAARFPQYSTEIMRMDKGLYSALNCEEHQTKIPGAHMALAALENGIHSTWLSYFEVDKVAKLLKLPANYIPSEIIAFGYPAGEVKPRTKKKIEEIVFYNSYRQ